MESRSVKRYDTCELLYILEDIPSDYDNTSEVSSELDDDDDDYFPLDIDDNEDLEERNISEFDELAAPAELSTSKAETKKKQYQYS